MTKQPKKEKLKKEYKKVKTTAPKRAGRTKIPMTHEQMQEFLKRTSAN